MNKLKNIAKIIKSIEAFLKNSSIHMVRKIKRPKSNEIRNIFFFDRVLTSEPK